MKAVRSLSKNQALETRGAWFSKIDISRKRRSRFQRREGKAAPILNWGAETTQFFVKLLLSYVFVGGAYRSEAAQSVPEGVLKFFFC